MIITLLALTSALSLILSLVLFKRLQDLSARVALNKASITANNPLLEYDLDNLALLLELSPLLTDASTESALRDLIDFLEYNNGDLRQGLDTYFTGALDEELRPELINLQERVESLECQEYQDFGEVNEIINHRVQEIILELKRLFT